MASISESQTGRGLFSWMRRDGKPMKPSTREAWYGYFLASPWIIGFLVFTVGPMLASLIIGLYRTDFLTETTFVGFKWYQSVLRDSLVRKALINTALFIIIVEVAIPAGYWPVEFDSRPDVASLRHRPAALDLQPGVGVAVTNHNGLLGGRRGDADLFGRAAWDSDVAIRSR